MRISRLLSAYENFRRRQTSISHVKIRNNLLRRIGHFSRQFQPASSCSFCSRFRSRGGGEGIVIACRCACEERGTRTSATAARSRQQTTTKKVTYFALFPSLCQNETSLL